MALYVGDYLADTAMLNLEQSGAYLHLLMQYSRSGPLPDDDARLAVICKSTRTYFTRHIAPAVRPFFTVANGRLHQKRADMERQRKGEISEKRAIAARSRGVKIAPQVSPDNKDLAPANTPVLLDTATTTEVSKKDPVLRTAVLPEANGPEPPPENVERVLFNEPPDPRKAVWTEGVERIQALTGKPNGPSRSLLGRLLRDAKDDCAGLLAAIRECPATGDPVAWLTAAAKARGAPGFRNGFLTLIQREGIGGDYGDPRPATGNPVLEFLASAAD